MDVSKLHTFYRRRLTDIFFAASLTTIILSEKLTIQPHNNNTTAPTNQPRTTNHQQATSTNTSHNWFSPKQQHSDDRSQESIEARSSNEIDGPATAEETHCDEAQVHTEDTHTMLEDDDDNPQKVQMQIVEQERSRVGVHLQPKRP